MCTLKDLKCHNFSHKLLVEQQFDKPRAPVTFRMKPYTTWISKKKFLLFEEGTCISNRSLQFSRTEEFFFPSCSFASSNLLASAMLEVFGTYFFMEYHRGKELNHAMKSIYTLSAATPAQQMIGLSSTQTVVTFCLTSTKYPHKYSCLLFLHSSGQTRQQNTDVSLHTMSNAHPNSVFCL